jgi:hypothetical protein
MSSFPTEGSVVSGGGDSGLPFIEESGMVGHLLILEEDLDPVPEFMDFDLFPDQPFGDRIAVRIDLGKAFYVHRSIKGLVDRREIGGKRSEVRFFHQVGPFRTHAQGTFHFLVGHVLTPSFGLLVEILPVREGAARKKIIFCISKISFHFSLGVICQLHKVTNLRSNFFG